MRLLLLALAVLAVTPGIAETVDLKPTLAVCENEISERPKDFDAYRCFDRLSRVPGGRAPAREFLEARVAGEPDNVHANTMLARLLDPRTSRPLDLLGEAIRDYEAGGERRTQGWATIYRSRVHMVNLRVDEADADAEAATALAVEVDDYPLLAMCRFQQSRLASLTGDDGTLFGVLRKLVLDRRFETLSPGFRTAVLQNLGSVCAELGLHETGIGYLEQAEGIALDHELGDWLFDVRHSMSSVAMTRFLDGELERAVALEIARNALAVADGPRQVSIGELRVAELTPGEEGLRMLRELAAARDGESFGGFEVLTSLGLRLLEEGPAGAAEAMAPLESALASTRRGGFRRNIVRGWVNLSRARLELGPREEALETVLSAMDVVEDLHDIQTGESIGALNFSAYSPIYYTTLGKLLNSTDRSFEDLDLALAISERLRSRFLIDHLDRAGVAGESEQASERKEVLRKISELQTVLLLSKTAPEDRPEIERQLEQLEEEEALLRAEADRAAPSRDVGGEVSLEAIQRELRGDEALLSFLLSSPREGGSWVLVVTSTEVRAYPLPSRRRLETAVRFWIGLLQRGDGTDREPAARLYADVLAAVIEDLPPGVGRMTIVPDGPLHRIPFDALRPSADAPPLLDRFEITHVPSARVWLRLRAATASGEPDALLLADPELSAPTLEHSALRAFRLADVSIGRLPHARKEANRAARSLGRGELRVGAEANEAFVKGADLGSYRVLHFAAHALIDENRPDRSAILLAPGNDTEDGLLQAREVLDFRLPGAMVTLSACQSAAGRVLVGEGVMGLARSFFQARASVVVGGLWPLRDEVTARLMASFYEGLGRGLPAGEAMTRAKREMHREGFPPAAWAGVVVLGDGAHAPWPEPGATPSLIAAALGLILVTLFLALLLARRNRFRRQNVA